MNNASPSEVFPDRLRAARDQRGLSQDDLANRAGLQSSAISHFETGARKPSFHNLRRLADALDVTTDYLLGRVKEIDGLAGSDRLHRHYSRLTAEDRDIADGLMELLAKKTHNRARKPDK
jgi:transcriptional regulator with XRE-family HTH domain